MLHGELVRLRSLEISDAERAHAWVNDREVTQFTSARYPYSVATEEAWLRDMPANSFAAGVRLAIESFPRDVKSPQRSLVSCRICVERQDDIPAVALQAS